MSEIQQARICAEKFSDDDHDKIQDIRYGAQSESHGTMLKAAFITSKLWPAFSEIKIGFLSNKKVPKTKSNKFGTRVDPINDEIMSLNSVDCVKKVVTERIMPIVNLKIIFVDNPKDAQIRIGFDERDGAWSYLGTDCLNYKYPKPTMNFGWIDAPTIMHEFGHAIGALIHEHQNPKGKTIPWDKQAVYKWAKETQGWNESTTNENILNRYDINTINGSQFDPLSIMLYFFPPSLTTNKKGTEINGRFSGYDVQWINDMYKVKAPETATEFYQRVYNESLESAINNSNKANDIIVTTENYKQFSADNKCKKTIEKTNFYMVLGILLLIIVFIILLKK
jgi:hypothetical protein